MNRAIATDTTTNTTRCRTAGRMNGQVRRKMCTTRRKLKSSWPWNSSPGVDSGAAVSLTRSLPPRHAQACATSNAVTLRASLLNSTPTR